MQQVNQFSRCTMPTKATHSIIVANDLQTGRSVFLTSESGWSEIAGEAQLLQNGSDAEARLELALNDEKNNLVIDPYLIDVASDRQVRETREQIRTTGPTIFANNQVADALVADNVVAENSRARAATAKPAAVEAA